MKYKICLVLVFLLPFCSIGVKAYTSVDNLYLNKVECELSDSLIFHENGVRAVYKTNLIKQDEIKDIKKKLERKFNREVEVNNDEIHIRTSLRDIDVNFLSNNENTTVDLTIINYDKRITILNLMKELTELQGKKIFDIRYFQYIKGKINSIDEIISKIKSLQEITKIDTLDIHNGYVGTGKFNDGERVNIALNSYDTGNYLIIGTPVIFTTY